MAQGDLTKREGRLHTAVTSARRRSRPGRYGRTEWPCMAALPERTFFNTPKRVIICHLICRPTPLPKASAKSILAKERVLLYAVSEIGETRDARRLPERSDLPDLVTAYRLHRAGAAVTAERAVSVSAADLYKLDSINIRHHWPSEMARKLGLLGASEDPMEMRREIETQVKNMRLLALDWRKGGGGRSSHRHQPPPTFVRCASPK